MTDGKWDHRFLELAKNVSTWSKDPSTQVGAVIVRPNKTVCSLGYNGFPMSMEDDKEAYKNRDVKLSRVVHAEMNALIFAREPVVGYTLFTYPFLSCDRCAVHMIQAGIYRFVAPKATDDIEKRWMVELGRSRAFIRNAGCMLMEI